MLDIVSSRTNSGVRGASERKPILLCFSHLRWNFVYQRPQHLLSRAASDYKVVFFEEPLVEDRLYAELAIHVDVSGVTVVTPLLPRGLSAEQSISAQKSLLDGLLARQPKAPLVCWYYSPMMLAFSAHLEPDLCVYDCMDELSGFRGAPPALREFERQLFGVADLVFTGGISLYQAKRSQHKNVYAFPSSIDAPHFARARTSRVDPADQAKIARPRVGFFGVVDERMDLGLVAALADLRPDWQFVMIGPVVKIDPATLPVRPNIHWLGSKSYAELPAYLSGWSVGMMAFAINEATHFISPTKTPEFLAAGLPVVSTPITDVVRSYGDQGLVEIAASAADFAAKAADLMVRPRQEWLARVDAQLAHTSWDRTWKSMAGLMQAARTPKARVRAATASSSTAVALTAEGMSAV